MQKRPYGRFCKPLASSRSNLYNNNMRTLIPFNKVIKFLILSDFLLYSAWGLIAPIIAIYFVDAIEGGNVQVVGISAGIYFITKSLLQIPIGRYLDRNHGEIDDYWFMVIGTLLASFIPLLYIFIREPWHLYAAQAVYAIGMAMAIPAWGGIFMRHIDKGKEAQSWSIESSSMGIGAGITGIVGGTVAAAIGFTPLFVIVFVFGLVSVATLLVIRKNIFSKTLDKRHPRHIERAIS